MYTNEENIIAAPITKGIEIIMGIQVCVISWMNINYKEGGGKKLFMQFQNINIMYPKEKNMIVVPTTKWMEIIMIIQACLISWINIDYKENGRRKSFSCKSKA